MKKTLLAALLAVTLLSFSPRAQAALISLDGGKMYYDDVLNITWLTAGSTTTMTWADANKWAADLNIDGVTGWRLPTTTDTGTYQGQYSFQYNGSSARGYNVTNSEMGYLYHTALGNLSAYDATGKQRATGTWGLLHTGPFTNLQAYGYWSATAYDSANAWLFDFYSGYQKKSNEDNLYYALAVHDGLVVIPTPAPIPPAFLLFSSGIAIFAALRRKTGGRRSKRTGVMRRETVHNSLSLHRRNPTSG